MGSKSSLNDAMKKPNFAMKIFAVMAFFFIVFFLGYVTSYYFTSVPVPLQPPIQIKNDVPLQPPIQIKNDDFYKFPSVCAKPLTKHDIVSTISSLFKKKSPYVDFPPPHIGQFLSHNYIRGWGSTNPVFELVIRQARPKVIIEVGTFLGKSALHMANLTRVLGLTDTIILCLDDFRGWPGFGNNGMFKHIVDINGDVILMHQFMQNVVDAGEKERILPIPFSTGAALDALCLWGVYGDVVEVDAGHTFHSAWDDINRAWKILKPGGIMFGHDYFNRADEFGVRRAVDLFAKVKRLRVVPNGQHWILYP